MLEDERHDNLFRSEIDCEDYQDDEDDENVFFDAQGDFANDVSEGEIDEEAIISEENSSAIQEGSYIAEYIQKVINNLNKNKQGDKMRLPMEYEKGKKFWVDNEDPYFALKRSSEPSNLYTPRVFLWFPDHLINSKLQCTNASCGNTLTSKGLTKGRRIIDVEE